MKVAVNSICVHCGVLEQAKKKKKGKFSFQFFFFVVVYLQVLCNTVLSRVDV